MAITVTSAVARATPASGSNATITTGAFVPAVNEYLVAIATFDVNPPSTAFTLSSTQENSWTQVQRSDGSTAPLNNHGTAIWVMGPVSTASSRTVTASSSGAFFCSLQVYRVAATSGSIGQGATGAGGSATANTTASIFTSTVSGSVAIVGAGSLLSTSNTVSSSDLTASAFCNTAIDDLAVISGFKTLGAPGAQTANFSGTGTNNWHWVAIELYEVVATSAAWTPSPVPLGMGAGPAIPGAPMQLDPLAQGAVVDPIPHVVVADGVAIGLSATATASKVVSATARASLGTTGLATARKVAPEAARSAVGLAGVSTARKVAPEAASAALGLVGTTTARKVGTPTTSGALGLSGLAGGVHLATATARGALGLAGTGADKKILTPVSRAALGLAGSGADTKKATGTTTNAALGLAGTGAGRKVAPETARGAVGLAGLTTAKHVGTPSAAGTVGLTGYSGAINKRAGVAGSASLGLAGTGTGRKVAIVATGGPAALGLSADSKDNRERLLSGLAVFGLSAWANPTKTAGTSASAGLGLTGSGSAVHKAVTAARSVLGLAGSGADTKKATGTTARSALGATASGTARKVATPSARGLVGVVGSAAPRKLARAASTAVLGLLSKATAGKTTAKTAVSSIGLSAVGRFVVVRAFTARAALGLSAITREILHFETRRLGGWASLEAILQDERSYLQTYRSEALLACPYCGEPLIGDVCTFDAIHVAQNGPPVIAEETMPTDPGPWGSLTGILRDAADNARDEARTPELACPRCGEPLVAGHCTYDGYQTWTADE